MELNALLLCLAKDVYVTRQPTRRTTAPSILTCAPGSVSRAGFYGSDVFKQLAQPCTGAANQARRDNLSRVDRGLMPGSSKAAREFNARRDPM